jgi:osmotically-inducible protein OsmY
MFGHNQISDKELSKTVGARLSRVGGSRITATIQQGTVTLTGTLQYAIQRSPIVKAASCVAGVRRVVDSMQLVERKRV